MDIIFEPEVIITEGTLPFEPPSFQVTSKKRGKDLQSHIFLTY